MTKCRRKRRANAHRLLALRRVFPVDWPWASEMKQKRLLGCVRRLDLGWRSADEGNVVSESESDEVGSDEEAGGGRRGVDRL